MDDLISRQEAIAHLKKRLIETAINNIGVIARCDSIFEDTADNRIGPWINELPSAQPERKRGKWIAVTEDGDVYKRICSCCGKEAFFQNDDPDELYDGGRYELSDFCPHCGAKMEVYDGSD